MYCTQQRRKRRRLLAEINVVPYIDVTLVLLVIFMIAAPMLTQGVSVNLPTTDSRQEDVPKISQSLLISVDAQGRYYLNVGKTPDRPLSAEALSARVSVVLRHQPDTPVLVGGDRRVPYGAVMEVMALLKKAGADRIGLITKMAPPKERH